VLIALKESGLTTMPARRRGVRTAVRATIADNKLRGEEWIAVHARRTSSHPVQLHDLYGTSNRARPRRAPPHARNLQDETGGFLDTIRSRQACRPGLPRLDGIESPEANHEIRST